MAIEKQKTTKAKKFFLLKKTFRAFLFIAITSCASVFLLIYLIKNNRESTEKMNNLIIEKSATLARIKELDRKLGLTKTYIGIWDNEIPVSMKNGDGVNIENIKNLLERLAKRHYFINNSIKFSIPADVPASKTSTFKFSNVEITMNFGCLTEYSIYNFLKNLKEKSDFGIYVIESLEIKKANELDRQFIKNLLTSNEMKPLLNVSLKLQWYEFKKEN